MPRIDDVKESEAKKNYRLLRRTARVTPGNNQSVTGGRTRFIGLESLLVIGSQLVSGLLSISGSLEGVGAIIWRGSIKVLGLGTLDVAGPAKFSATLDVTADTRLRGPTTIEDTLDVTAETTLRGATTIDNTLDVAAETILRGLTELQADLKVTAGGTITVEGVREMLIGLLSNGYPGIQFPAARVTSTASGMLLSTVAGGGQLGLSGALANLSVGSTSVSMDGEAVSVLGDFKTFGDVYFMDLPTITNIASNVGIDDDGKFGTV